MLIEYYTDPATGRVPLTPLYSDLERFKKAKLDRKRFDITTIQDYLSNNKFALVSREKLTGYTHPVTNEAEIKKFEARIDRMKSFYKDNFK